MKYDILIKNGQVIDGTGADRFSADVGIRGERIAAVGDLSAHSAERVIDAGGKLVCPGFIDPHSHADLNLLIWPENEGNVMQGITTTIAGNCGMTPAPLKHNYIFSAWEYPLIYQVTKDRFNDIVFMLPLAESKAAFKELYDLDLDYETLGQFFDKAERGGFSVNYYPYAGHNQIRAEAMGEDCLRVATAEEIVKMQEILKREMKSGARGLSTGLDYPPGAFSTKEEVLALAKTAKELGGSYISHVRATSYYLTGSMTMDLISGVREAIEIGRQTGIRVHIAHMTPPGIRPGMSREEVDRTAGDLLAVFDEAIADGVDISFDVIPNVSGGGCTINTFAYLAKPWVLECGDVAAFLRRIDSDPAYRAKVVEEMGTSAFAMSNINMNPNAPDTYTIVRSTVADFVDKTLREIMNQRGWSFEESIFEVLKADPKANIKLSMFGVTTSWLNIVLAHPACIPSSDGFSYNKDSNIGLSDELSKLPHPNNFCYTIRYLTHHRLPRLEDNIRQMTGYAAQRFSIPDRGLVKEGLYADLVVLDEKSLNPNENYADSRVFPDGVEYVLINGAVTGEGKAHTGAKAGRILKGV